jgi:hypothetical protein
LGRYRAIQQELTERFDGVTAFTRAPAHGGTKDAGRVVHDEIILVEVMTEVIERAWWHDYRQSLEKRFAPGRDCYSRDARGAPLSRSFAGAI